MRFAELDSFVDGVLNGGPLEQKLQAPGRVVLVMSGEVYGFNHPTPKVSGEGQGVQ